MLSDKAIQALRPDPDRPGTKHHDRDGLYLWVASSGSKTWRLELNTWIKTGIDPRTQGLRPAAQAGAEQSPTVHPDRSSLV